MDVIKIQKEHSQTFGSESTKILIANTSLKYEYLVKALQDWELTRNQDYLDIFWASGEWNSIQSSNIQAVKAFATLAKCARKEKKHCTGPKAHWVYPPGFLGEVCDAMLADIRANLHAASDTTRDFIFSNDLGL